MALKGDAKRTHARKYSAAKNREDQMLVIPRNDDGTWARVDLDRWTRCSESLESFCLEYLPETFCWPFSEDHRAVLRKTENAVREGGLFAEAMPRGNGKTTICEAGALWAILYNHIRYVVLVGATERKAVGLLDDCKTYLIHNERLHDDFPEIRALSAVENLAFRAKNLILDTGKPAGLVWKTNRVVLPIIHGDDVRECVIEVAGITGDIRGKKYTCACGTVIRPDLALIDDPQTLESAGSPTQTEDRENVIRKDILGLAGPGKKIAALMPCTVISSNDLAEKMLNREENPDWQGERTRMITDWPENVELWEEYNRARIEGIQNEDKGKAANKFYRDNREALEEGAAVGWEERKNEDDISALQTAMNLYFRNGAGAFASEYQNEPLEQDTALYDLQPEVVASRVNGLDAGVMHTNASFLTAFADINRIGFHWAICATRMDMTVDVVRYGRWPVGGVLWEENEQDENKAVYARILEFVPWLTNEVMVTQNGDKHKLDWCMIDCGYWMSTVARAVQVANRQAGCPVWPSRGYGSRTYKTPAKSRAIATGDMWDIRKWADGTKVVAHNAHFWRRHVQQAFLLPTGAPGSISFAGNDTHFHTEIARHVCANRLMRFIQGDGERYDLYDWQQKDPRDDWSDAIVGAIVGAARLGAVVGGVGTKARPKKRGRARKVRVTYTE